MDDLAALADLVPTGALSTHHGELAARAHDQWSLALLREIRGDRVAPPAAVVWPSDTAQVAAVLSWAMRTGTALVTRGGGTGRSGGSQAVPRSILLDTTRLNRVLGIDEVSQTVRTEAGVRLTDLEEAVLARGLTLDHGPEGMGQATVGGWIAGGAPSAAEGALGMTVVVAGGAILHLPEAPGAIAGPDLRRLLVGSEGTLAVITEATLAARRAPAEVCWEVFRPHSFDAGLSLTREIAQRPFRPVALRLLDPAGAGGRFAAFGEGHRPLLMMALDGGAPAVDAERFELRQLARDFGARALERDLAQHWWAHRGDDDRRYEDVMGPERSLGEGVVADTIVVASLWRTLPRLYEEVRGALLDRAETVGCHVDRASSWGASLSFDFVVRAPDDRRAEREYLAAWESAATVSLERGGTLAPGEGVGVLAPGSLAGQLGEEGAALLSRIKEAADPAGVMNPGKLFRPPGYDGRP